MTVRLYVGNLPKEVIERDNLQEMFAEEGDTITAKVIKDRKTGKCRGFAFVTVPDDAVADQFIEKYNGQSFMESPLKIEKALPRSKGKGKETEQEEGASSQQNQPNSRRQKNKRSRNQHSGGAGNHQSDSFQPDPRWASQLSKLKEMLSAQTAN